MSAVPRHYDIVMYDTVGMPYTGATPRRGGLGGSEFQAILLAEALAEQGRRVLVLNRTAERVSEFGVEYANHQSIATNDLTCDVLIVQRYSPLPAIPAQRVLVAAADIPGHHYDHFGAMFATRRDATLVAVSEWQRALFPAHWPCVVVPNMLPDVVYAVERPPPTARKFVYASAALKGLDATLAAWRELCDGGGMQDAELCVCTPGYDRVDADALHGAGVRFAGSLPFAQVVEEIASSAGLFYVNTWSETFCIVAALAEALGRRVHVLCTSDAGALPQTVSSPLVTTDRTHFLSDFRAALADPGNPRWYGTPRDYRQSTILPRWLELIDAPARKPAQTPRARICLSMIVKNEAHVIERCLRSVKPWIDAWAISDTGSGDGTQDIIRNHLADLPGELIERPWRDFASNRNDALELARQYAEYALVIDADDEFAADPGFAWPALDAPGYMIEILDQAALRYWRVALVRTDAPWHWHGVVHEALHHPPPVATPRLPGARILRVHNDGARSRQTAREKFLGDAEVLRRALQAEPHNARYQFYLAQSLRDAGDLPGAIAEYARRVAMGGWAEEVYYAQLQVGLLAEHAGRPYAEVVAGLLDACNLRPQRAEAPCELARYFRLHKRWNLARHFAHIATSLAPPDDVLFIDRSVHDWRARDELAIAAYWCGDYAESARLCRELLADARLPEGERARVQSNLEFSLPHLNPQAGAG